MGLVASVIPTRKGSIQRRTWETVDHSHAHGGPQEESLSPNIQPGLLLRDQTGETVPGTSLQTPSPPTSPQPGGDLPLVTVMVPGTQETPGGKMLGGQCQPSAPSSSSAARAALHGQDSIHCFSWGWESFGSCSRWHCLLAPPGLRAELWRRALQLLVPPAGFCVTGHNPLSPAVRSVLNPPHFPLI